MCGDSTNAENVKKLLGDTVMDMIFTDPPYNVGYKSSGKNRDKWAEAYGDDDYNEEDFEEFCYKVFKNFKEHLKKGGVYYISSGYSSLSAFWRALRRLNLKPSGVIVWDKLNPGLGWSDYWYQHEQIIAGFNSGEEDDDFYNYIIYGFDDRSKRYFKKSKRLSDIWRVKREATISYVHPTQKPVKLIENALFNSSKRGDLILDLFGGSGSTLIACEKNERMAYLIERSPLFCDVIRARYDNFKHSQGGNYDKTKK
jgi:DNA modification methylase